MYIVPCTCVYVVHLYYVLVHNIIYLVHRTRVPCMYSYDARCTHIQVYTRLELLYRYVHSTMYYILHAPRTTHTQQNFFFDLFRVSCHQIIIHRCGLPPASYLSPWPVFGVSSIRVHQALSTHCAGARAREHFTPCRKVPPAPQLEPRIAPLHL